MISSFPIPSSPPPPTLATVNQPWMRLNAAVCSLLLTSWLVFLHLSCFVLFMFSCRASQQYFDTMGEGYLHASCSSIRTLAWSIIISILLWYCLLSSFLPSLPAPSPRLMYCYRTQYDTILIRNWSFRNPLRWSETQLSFQSSANGMIHQVYFIFSSLPLYCSLLPSLPPPYILML